MKSTKLILSVFLLTIFTLSLTNITFSIAGWQTDPAGDAGGINTCDIVKVNIDVVYHTLPADDEVTLNITLAEAPLMDETHTVRHDYNFRIDTSLHDTNPDTTTWSTDVYEYRAHLDTRWIGGDTWLNTSYLMANRYYLTGDGSAKVMGTFWWNPNTDTWQASDPGVNVAEIVGNSIIWDVTHAIFREQPVGTGYVIQGVAGAWYGFVLKDIGPNSGWVDEFDNCCVFPSDTTTPTSLFPSVGFIFSMVFLGLVVSSVTIIRKRRK